MPPIRSTGNSGNPWLKWGVPLAIVVLVAAALSGLAGRSFYEDGNASAAPPDGASPSGTEPVTPPAQPGSIVLTEDASEHPDHETVRWVLQTHFDAINFHRYDTWKTTVVAAKQAELPEEKWKREYASTRDSDIVVHRIESGADDSLRVLLTFTSRQDPEDSPDGLSPCVRWRVVYPLVQESGGMRLDTGRLPGSSRYNQC